MPNLDQIEWIQALNSTLDNPNRKLDALLRQIESSSNPTELLCYQNEVITVLSRNCPKKQPQEKQPNTNSIDLDESFRSQLESLIVGNDEVIDFDEVNLIEKTSFESSFQSAKQQLAHDVNKQPNRQFNKQVNSLFNDGNQNSSSAQSSSDKASNAEVPECLRNVDPKMIEAITNEVIVSCTNIEWDQIAGLEHAKSVIKEIVIWPMLRP